jgi:CheY-like chemotaxis protein
MNVAIIDDDEMCLLMLSHCIRTSSFHAEPKSFKTAVEGLDFLRNVDKDAEPVVFFLDINMPEMDGWEFLDIIHQEFTDVLIYVIVVTSSVSVSDESRARSWPRVIEYITKPVVAGNLQKIQHMICP